MSSFRTTSTQDCGNARSRQTRLSLVSLDAIVFPDVDYARLKRSYEYFVEHYAPAELNAPGSHTALGAGRAIADEPRKNGFSL